MLLLRYLANRLFVSAYLDDFVIVLGYRWSRQKNLKGVIALMQKGGPSRGPASRNSLFAQAEIEVA